MEQPRVPAADRRRSRGTRALLPLLGLLAVQGPEHETRHYRLAHSGTVTEHEAEAHGELLEQCWKEFKDFMGTVPRLKKGERLEVSLYADREAWVEGLRAEGAAVPDGLDFLWFRPETGRLHLYEQETAAGTRTLLIYGAWQQFHCQSKSKHRDLTHSWFVRGLGEHFSFHYWDAGRLELGVDSFLRPGRDFPARALERLQAFDDVLDHLPFELLSEPDVHFCLVRYLLSGENGRHRRRFQKLALGSEGSKLTGPEYAAAIDDPERLIRGFYEWLQARQTPWEVVLGEWQETRPRAAKARPVRGRIGLALLDAGREALSFELGISDDPADSAGAVLGYEDPATLLLVRMEQGELVIEEYEGGKPRRLAAFLPPKTAKASRAFSVSVTEEGSVTVVVDGERAGSWTPARPRLGLSVARGEAVFEHVDWR